MGGFMGRIRCAQVSRRNASIRASLIKKGLIPKDFVEYKLLKDIVI